MNLQQIVRDEIEKSGVKPEFLRYSTKDEYGYNMGVIANKQQAVLEKITKEVRMKYSSYSSGEIADALFYASNM